MVHGDMKVMWMNLHNHQTANTTISELYQKHSNSVIENISPGLSKIPFESIWSGILKVTDRLGWTSVLALYQYKTKKFKTVRLDIDGYKLIAARHTLIPVYNVRPLGHDIKGKPLTINERTEMSKHEASCIEPLHGDAIEINWRYYSTEDVNVQHVQSDEEIDTFYYIETKSGFYNCNDFRLISQPVADPLEWFISICNNTH